MLADFSLCRFAWTCFCRHHPVCHFHHDVFILYSSYSAREKGTPDISPWTLDNNQKIRSDIVHFFLFVSEVFTHVENTLYGLNEGRGGAFRRAGYDGCLSVLRIPSSLKFTDVFSFLTSSSHSRHAFDWYAHSRSVWIHSRQFLSSINTRGSPGFRTS